LEKKTSIGGQGVMDGVMMRSEKIGALAIRRQTGEIATKQWDITAKTSKLWRLPIFRGMAAFVDSMVGGVKVLSDAVELGGYEEEAEQPGWFERFVAKKTGKSIEDVMMVFAVIAAIGMAIVLFFILPTLVTGFFKTFIKSTLLLNLIDGVIRILIFLAYVFSVSFIKEIKDVFRYHGAEHKTIACYEAGDALTAENAKKHSRLHPRCGTSYLLIVMIITMVIYSFFTWSSNLFLRIGLRLLMLPLIAGVSYELLRLLAKSENIIVRMLRWPGMQLQRLTTAEPTEDMLNVAILAFEMALGEKSEAELEEMKTSFSLAEEEIQGEAVEADAVY
jgi:uncharacterized protein YqhQ